MKDPYIFDFIEYREDMTKPIGVSEYKFMEELPAQLKNTFPDVDEISSRINIKQID